MEPYRVGDAVRIRSFDELKADPAVIDHGFSDGGGGFYGIDDDSINNWAEFTGLLFIREVGISNGTAGGTDYRLETADGGPIPYYWLHCMLRPYEFGSEEPIDPGSLEDLFDFLQD